MADLPRFARPYDTGRLDQAVRAGGAAVLVGLLAEDLRARIRAGIDHWLDEHRSGAPGLTRAANSVCVHSVLNKVPVVVEVLIHPDLLRWARRMLAPLSRHVLLTAAEYRERLPGEPPRPSVRGLHRGTDVWPHVPIGAEPVSVYAIVALGPFTPDNGATWFALGSHRPPDGRPPDPSTLAQAIMDPGDAVVFRSDVLHGVGSNVTVDQPLRTLSVGYQVDWLRPVENGTLAVPPALASTLPDEAKALLGYGTQVTLGLYDGGDPADAIPRHSRPAAR
jgi:hypothetical protein